MSEVTHVKQFALILYKLIRCIPQEILLLFTQGVLMILALHNLKLRLHSEVSLENGITKDWE